MIYAMKRVHEKMQLFKLISVKPTHLELLKKHNSKEVIGQTQRNK